MKAKPLKAVAGGRGYEPCDAADATHIQLHFPGPFPNRILPVMQKGTRAGTGNWTWNGDTERPTLKPSILTHAEFGEARETKVCHSYVNDGRIQFLSDCTHEYRDQTVDLLEVE
jgi:hypothetical protein